MRDRLSAALTAVSPHLHSIEVPSLRTEHIPLLEVSSAFVRGTYQNCKSVLALADAHEWGGIVTVERAAWEMWNELDFLLRLDNAPHAAAKVQANAVLDVIAVLEKAVDSPVGMLERNRDFLAKLQQDYPDACEEVAKQREKKKWHWSGLSRSKVVGPDGSSVLVYKLLSWESHPDIVSIRDIEVKFEGSVARVTLGDEGDGVATIDRSCRSAAELLLRTWNLFANFWSLPKVEGLAGWNEDG